MELISTLLSRKEWVEEFLKIIKRDLEVESRQVVPVALLAKSGRYKIPSHSEQPCQQKATSFQSPWLTRNSLERILVSKQTLTHNYKIRWCLLIYRVTVQVFQVSVV